MGRSANYTLLGYKYQFLKTYFEILCSNDEVDIVCERFEDIDIESKGSELRIQCKYHETAETYTLSKIYKPLLEFMRSYVLNDDSKDIKYHLFVHFPDKVQEKIRISEDDCNKALSSKDKKLSKIINEINVKGINVKAVISHITVEFACNIIELENRIITILLNNGFSDDEINQYVLSNGIALIFDVSCKENESDRKITKQKLLNKLRSIKTILINKWIKEFYSIEEFLKMKKTVIKIGIDRRHCNRTFVFDKELCSNKGELVNFIKDLREKIHSNTRQHINNVLILALDLEADNYTNILKLLYKENLEIHTGYRLDEFNEDEFLMSPALDMNRIAVRGIPIRVLQLNHIETLNKIKPDIYYLIGTNGEKHNIDIFSVTCEELPLLTYNQLKYIFNMRGDYT